MTIEYEQKTYEWTYLAYFRVPKITVQHTPPPPLSLSLSLVHSSSCEVCDKQLLAAPVSPTYVHIYHRYIKKHRPPFCLPTYSADAMAVLLQGPFI
jgi:hypothetical protein